MSTSPVALVTGSGGVIGRNVIKHFVEQGIRTRGVSRRPPADTTGWEHIAADLLDVTASTQAFSPGAADTTRLVFGAYIEKKDPTEQIEVNLALLANTLDALKSAGAPLEHVTLYQGNKFYGAHLGDFKTPAREDDPRLIAPNFYYNQEDLLRARAGSDGFAFTIFRPRASWGTPRAPR